MFLSWRYPERLPRQGVHKNCLQIYGQLYGETAPCHNMTSFSKQMYENLKTCCMAKKIKLKWSFILDKLKTEHMKKLSSMQFSKVSKQGFR